MLQVKHKIFSAEDKKNLRKDRLLLALSGIMTGLSFPPMPFPFSLLIFFSLVPYFHVVGKRETLGAINRASYFMYFFLCLVTIYWVGSWQAKADPFLMISGGLLLFVNPAVFLITPTIFYFAGKIFKSRKVIYLFPFFWITYEYAHMLTDLSFPWLTLGNALTKFNLFIQSADIAGAHGLTFAVVAINVLVYKFIFYFKTDRKRSAIHISIAVFLFSLVLLYGIIRKNSFELSDKKITVGVVQPDIDPWDKWETGSTEQISNLYLSMSEKLSSDKPLFLLWPETAIPVYLLGGGYQGVVNSIYQYLVDNNVYLLTGLPDVVYHYGEQIPADAKKNITDGTSYSTFNAVVLLSPYTNEVQRYGKMKLVPFGERVPFVDALPFLGDWIRWGVGISGWNVGKDTTVFKLPVIDEQGRVDDTIKVVGLVCYESIYPDFVAGFVNRGGEIITVVTNDSWYGNSSGPYQHKEIAVLRAIENRRSVIRSANGGISCYIDPLGKTIYETPMFTKESFTAEVIVQETETFYTKNPLIFPVVSSVLSLWILLLAFLIRLKEKFKL